MIVDTGPLVALISRNDAHHKWAAQMWANSNMPMLTCEAVVAEACYLLRTLPNGVRAVLELIQRGRMEVRFSLAVECESVLRLSSKYQDMPMSFADACLVRMSELHLSACVFTLDADFKLYRRNGRQAIPILFPDQRKDAIPSATLRSLAFHISSVYARHRLTSHTNPPCQ